MGIGRRSRQAQPADPTTQNLGRTATSALTWSFVNTAASRFGTIAIGIALARLLGPEAFGTFAIATVALLAVLSFNELGVSLAIVRWQGDPKEIAPTVTTISIVSSFALTFSAILAAPSFAAAMGDPSAAGVVQVMMVCILINGIVATPAALMQRDFRQKSRMAIDQVNVWVGAAISIALTLLGFGAMSLAIGRLTGTLLAAVMFITMCHQPLRLGFSRKHATRLLKFGLPLAGSSVIVFAIGYADQIVTGGLLGPTQLGYYVLAFNLASWPVTLISGPVRNVAPAALSRLRGNSEAMTSSMHTLITLLAIVALPMCAALAGAALSVVTLLYGSAWAPAAPALQWLAVFAAFRIIFELCYDYLVVVGRTTSIFLIQMVWFAALVPALVVGAKQTGLPGLAGAQAVVALLVVTPLYLVELKRSGLTVRAILGGLGPALSAALLVALTAILAEKAVSGPLAVCAISGSVCICAILALLYRKRPQITAIKNVAGDTT